MSYKSDAYQGDEEPQRASTPELSLLKPILDKAYHTAVRNPQDPDLEQLVCDFINLLGINHASQSIHENLGFLLDYLQLNHNEISSLSAKLICILMYKNELMQRHILSVKSFLKFGRIIYFNVPPTYEERTFREIERCAIYSENSPAMICYLFPDSEDSPQYKPEKIIDCTIDTSNQFIGFRVSSDALDKLLQEPSREELPPILEISSVDNESQRKSPAYSISSQPRLLAENSGKNTISKRNFMTNEVEHTTQTTESYTQANAKYDSVIMGRGDSRKPSLTLNGPYGSALTEGDISNKTENISPVIQNTLTSSPTPKFSTESVPKRGGRSNSTFVHSNFAKDMNQSFEGRHPRRPSQPAAHSRISASRRDSTQANSRNQSVDLSNSNNKSFDSTNQKQLKNFKITSGQSSWTRKSSRTQEMLGESQSRSRPFSGVVTENSLLHSTSKMNSTNRNNTSLFVLEEENIHEDQQLNTPLSKEVYHLIRRTENEKYINYVQKLKEYEKPKISDQAYMNPLAIDLKKQKMSSTKKHFVEDYSYYFDPKVQAELRKEQKEDFKVVKPIDKMLYLRLAPRTVNNYKWKYQPAKYRLEKESVVIPELDYKIQPPKAPTKPIKKRLERTLKVEQLWDNSLNDDKREAYLADEFHLDVTSNIDDYLGNLNDLQTNNEKIFGAKYSYYKDVLKYYDSKHEDGNISPEAIEYADQEVKYLLDWKKGKVECGLDTLEEQKKLPKKKKEKVKDSVTQQENYFPKEPAVIKNTGFIVANTEDPEEFLSIQRQNSIRKPSRRKKTQYPLLGDSPLVTDQSPLNSPIKTKGDTFEFKISPTRIPSS